MDIRFEDHASFHRAAAGMVGGAALFGLALHPLTPLAPLAGGLLGVAAGAVFAYGRPAWRAAAATAAVAVLWLAPASWASLAAVSAIVAVGLGVGGPRGWRGALGGLFGALMVLTSLWCAVRIGGAQETSTWSPLLRDAITAGAVGIVGAMATLPRHLGWTIDPVRAALRGLPANLDAEVRALCARAVAIWDGAQGTLVGDGLGLLRDGVLKTLEVAARSAGSKRMGAPEPELAARKAELEQRISAATDPEVRAQYQAARVALEDQQRYRDHIRQGRERLVARMHNHVAALEKFELAATSLEAQRVAAEGTTALRQLDELSQDVAASGDALLELELGAAKIS